MIKKGRVFFNEIGTDKTQEAGELPAGWGIMDPH